MINRISKNKTSLWLSMLLFVLFACSGSDTPGGDNSWRSANLKGKVKRLMEVTYRASNQNGNWVKGPQNQTYTVKTYSDQGFLLNERTYYSDSNQPTGGFDYVYSSGNQLERINVVDPEGGIVSYSDIEKIDGNVGIRSYTDYFGLGDDTMVTSKTDMTWENFKLASASTFDRQGNLLTTSGYSYDSKGELISFNVKNIGGNQRDLTVTYSYLAYDDQGNWTQQLKQYDIFAVTEITERQYEYY